MKRPSLAQTGLAVEYLMALLVVGGLIRALIHVYQWGYLPQPFFYDPADSWMDWFNTADWARDIGVYDSWGTVYAPLTLVFLKLVGLNYCYVGGGTDSAYYARSCDWVGVGALHLIYVINIIIVAKTYLKADRRTALPRSLAIAMGLPMAATLERGNLLLLAFTCVALAYGPLVRSARLRWLAIGCAVNFKVYLVASLMPHLLRRRWRWVEGGLIATLAVYLLSWGLLGRGSPGEIYANVVAFRDVVKANQFLDVLYQATYAPFIELLESQSFPITTLIGSYYVNLLLVLLPLLLRLTQLSIVIAAIAAWLRPEAVPLNRLINLGLCMAFVSVESGGYSHLFPVYFVFLERSRGPLTWTAILLAYVLCLPFDFIIDRAPPLVHETFFNNSQVFITYYIMLGSFIRPLLFYAIAVLISLATVVAVYRDFATNGWQLRRRFRRDVQFGLASHPAKV